MRPAYTITSQPSCEPITYDQAAAHCRVDSTDDQAYISDLIPVAREYVDGVTGRASIQTAWKCTAATWEDLLDGAVDTIKLYRTPLVAVQSVKYYAEDATTLTTMPTSDYRVVTGYEPGLIQFIEDLPTLEPRPDAIQIAFTAGYATPDQTPSILKHAIKVCVADFYEQRVSIAFGQPHEVKPVLFNLLQNQRVGGWTG